MWFATLTAQHKMDELISHAKEKCKSNAAMYQEPPRRCFRLEHALSQYSKTTASKALVIAHECKQEYTKESGEVSIRVREYFAFHDIWHYLVNMKEYSHAHEVVMQDSGRVVFDFDLKHRPDGWVMDERFEGDVMRMVRAVLTEFYIGLDASVVTFTWLSSAHHMTSTPGT